MLEGKDSNILGVAVANRRHDVVGKVLDLAIHNRIAYLVLSLDGIARMRGSVYAVPWKVLQYDRESQAFVLNLQEEEIERLPVFENGAWPAIVDRYKNYGIESRREIPPF